MDKPQLPGKIRVSSSELCLETIQSHDLNPIFFFLQGVQELMASHLTLSFDSLAQWINAMPWAASLKNSQTQQYRLANPIEVHQQGFKRIEDFLALTFEELLEHRRQRINQLQGSLELESAYQTLLAQQQEVALFRQLQIGFTAGSLNYSGYIMLNRIQIIPMKDDQGAVNLMTLSEDITHQLDLRDLYRLYQQHYSVNPAILALLRYLKIDSAFPKLPAHRETVVLLWMQACTHSKFIANQMGINSRTVEEYKARLRNKLHGMTFEDLILKLRNHESTL